MNRRGVRSSSRSLRAGFDQRISPGRRHRLAPRQAAVRRGGGGFPAGSLQLPSSPQVGRGLGSLFTDRGAALRLHVGGSLTDHLGAQRSATGSPSLLHHFSYARQVANSLRKTSDGGLFAGFAPQHVELPAEIADMRDPHIQGAFIVDHDADMFARAEHDGSDVAIDACGFAFGGALF
jgi:hypothetical protein